MRFLILLLIVVLAGNIANAQTFNLPGDGNWYRVTSIGGAHGEFKYIYSHHTANRPAMLTGEI